MPKKIELRRSNRHRQSIDYNDNNFQTFVNCDNLFMDDETVPIAPTSSSMLANGGSPDILSFEDIISFENDEQPNFYNMMNNDDPPSMQLVIGEPSSYAAIVDEPPAQLLTTTSTVEDRAIDVLSSAISTTATPSEDAEINASNSGDNRNSAAPAFSVFQLLAQVNSNLSKLSRKVDKLSESIVQALSKIEKHDDEKNLEKKLNLKNLFSEYLPLKTVREVSSFDAKLGCSQTAHQFIEFIKLELLKDDEKSKKTTFYIREIIKLLFTIDLLACYSWKHCTHQKFSVLSNINSTIHCIVKSMVPKGKSYSFDDYAHEMKYKILKYRNRHSLVRTVAQVNDNYYSEENNVKNEHEETTIEEVDLITDVEEVGAGVFRILS